LSGGALLEPPPPPRYRRAREFAPLTLSHGALHRFICTGGEEESMRTVVGRDVVVLNKRKGFVRLAVAHGAALVPVFGVGISDLYTTYSFLLSLRMWLQKNTGVALPIFHGRFLSPLPYKVPLKVLVGDPIEIDPAHMPAKGEKPDPKIVDLYHRKYIEQLKEMHKEHGGGRVLEVL
jgi:2-acylglycerol O-acyltransferase 2